METTEKRKTLILEKPFLRKIYEEWYGLLISSFPQGKVPVLEIGSGGGFFGTLLPDLILSDIQPIRGIHAMFDACSPWPFQDGSLGAIVMVNVFHHLSRPRIFLAEAYRVLGRQGVIACIEPWVSCWSRFVYSYCHHEPFSPEAEAWEFPPTGPLSGANSALPYIIFQRDRERFEREFPGLKITRICPFMSFRYFLSGGLSFRSLVPQGSFLVLKRLEEMLRKEMWSLAGFVHIVLEKTR